MKLYAVAFVLLWTLSESRPEIPGVNEVEFREFFDRDAPMVARDFPLPRPYPPVVPHEKKSSKSSSNKTGSSNSSKKPSSMKSESSKPNDSKNSKPGSSKKSKSNTSKPKNSKPKNSKSRTSKSTTSKSSKTSKPGTSKKSSSSKPKNSKPKSSKPKNSKPKNSKSKTKSSSSTKSKSKTSKSKSSSSSSTPKVPHPPPSTTKKIPHPPSTSLPTTETTQTPPTTKPTTETTETTHPTETTETEPTPTPEPTPPATTKNPHADFGKCLITKKALFKAKIGLLHQQIEHDLLKIHKAKKIIKAEEHKKKKFDKHAGDVRNSIDLEFLKDTQAVHLHLKEAVRQAEEVANAKLAEIAKHKQERFEEIRSKACDMERLNAAKITLAMSSAAAKEAEEKKELLHAKLSSHALRKLCHKLHPFHPQAGPVLIDQGY